MSRKDEIAAAELAALVGGALHEVDTKRLDGGNAVQMHPRDFITSAPTTQTTNTAVIPKAAMVEQPKSRSAGTEVVGTENVNLGSLMIPMDGADAKMREAIAAYSNPAPAAPPPPQPKASVHPGGDRNNEHTTSMVAPTSVPNDSEVITLLKSIDKKLDLLLKRAKIQPRYKKNNK